MSSPSTITSPRLTPMRNRRRRSSARSKSRSAVACGLDDPAVMLADLRIDQFDEMRLEAFVRALLISTHQARIPHHISGEDRGETAGGGRGGHCSGGANSRAEF